MKSPMKVFAELYGGALLPTVVFSAALTPVYRNAQAELLLARLGGESALLTPAVRREAERCLAEHCGANALITAGDNPMPCELLPYPCCGAEYLVLRVVERLMLPEEREAMDLLRNAQGKLASCLNEIYGVSHALEARVPECAVIGQNVRRIMRMANHFYLSVDDENRYDYRVPLDIRQFIEAFVRNISEIGLKDIEAGVCSGSLVARAKPEDLELVLGTLVSNARRFGAAPITVSAARAGDRVLITVADHGPGVADPEQLFRLGYRTPDRTGGKGLGLGLAMAQRTAERWGAAIRYERENGETRFTVDLEAAALAEGQLAEWHTEPPENSLSQMRVELSDLL